MIVKVRILSRHIAANYPEFLLKRADENGREQWLRCWSDFTVQALAYWIKVHEFCYSRSIDHSASAVSFWRRMGHRPMVVANSHQIIRRSGGKCLTNLDMITDCIWNSLSLFGLKFIVNKSVGGFFHNRS